MKWINFNSNPYPNPTDDNQLLLNFGGGFY